MRLLADCFRPILNKISSKFLWYYTEVLTVFPASSTRTRRSHDLRLFFLHLSLKYRPLNKEVISFSRKLQQKNLISVRLQASFKSTSGNNKDQYHRGNAPLQKSLPDLYEEIWRTRNRPNSKLENQSFTLGKLP